MNKDTIQNYTITILLALLLGMTINLFREDIKNFLVDFKDTIQQDNTQHVQTDHVDTLLNYGSDLLFTNEDIMEQVCGIPGLKIEAYFVDTKNVYLSFLKEKEPVDFSGLTKNPERITFADMLPNGRQILDDYSFRSYDRIIFKIHQDYIDVDPFKKISVEVIENRFFFETNLNELRRNLSDQFLYSGKSHIKYTDSFSQVMNVYNHSRYVSKKEDVSINRLVRDLLEIKGESTQEEKMQFLTDFVTHAIEYDIEGVYGQEVLKRPVEILLSGKADCSGKTTLLASMLEQIGVEYVLVYYKGHINLAVKGNFKNYNNLVVGSEDNVFHIIETTYPGFMIGQTTISEKLKPLFTQFPGKYAYNYQDGKRAEMF